MPDAEELNDMFNKALVKMNLTEDQLLQVKETYNNEAKWKLIQEQERQTIKQTPQYYITRIKSYLANYAASKKKFKRITQNSTNLLRELEISLRTNHTGWLREFLHDKNNPGLDLLNEYLGFCLYAVVFGSFSDMFAKTPKLNRKNSGITKTQARHQNEQAGGHLPSYNNTLTTEGEDEDENDEGDDASSKIDIAVQQFDTIRRSHTLPAKRILKNSRILACKDDIYVCTLCFRSIFNYKYGFETVLEHKQVINQITLALVHQSCKTQATVLDLLGAVALIKGGHEMVLKGFSNFKMILGEKRRFQSLIKYLKKCSEQEEVPQEFILAALKFVNVIVHTVNDMNFRVHWANFF